MPERSNSTTTTSEAPATQTWWSSTAWAINSDFTFNSRDNSAGRGSWIAFWASGQGLVDPTGRDGEVIDFQHGQYKNLTRPVTVTIGGRVAQVISSRLIYTGEIQVSAYVPVDAPAGDAELPLSVGTATSRTGVTVSVK